MKPRAFIVILIVLLMLLLLGMAGADPLAPEEVKEHKEGPEIIIDDALTEQTNPAAAYSTKHGQFLVVYESSENNGDIYGCYVNALTGAAIGYPFEVVSTPANQSSNPDVAYDPYNDRFVVVWEEYQGTINPSIAATVLYGSHQSSGVQHGPGDRSCNPGQ